MIFGNLQDHYGILEVDRSADESAIKRSYRKKVLLWHPDKQPVDREAAEDNIRQVNAAYETLGNPQKRSQYDSQLQALERRATGVRLDTSAIQPRMSIPKEFMLCPMGQPDKFVRCVSTSLFVHSREDANLQFQAFFTEAKFSLWWMPQVNNMCHLRAQSGAARGQRGGISTLSVSFDLVSGLPGSEAKLNHVQERQTFFKVVASPVLQGAFRFEAQHWPGHYIAFRETTKHLVIVSAVDEKLTVVDFMLVDYASMYKYQTIEEVLAPAMESLGGRQSYVSLNALRDHKDVRQYFQGTLKKPVWTPEDFEAYFSGHWQDWDYDAQKFQVRMRTKLEKLSSALSKAKTQQEIAAAVSGAGNELFSLTVDSAESLLAALGLAMPDGADVSALLNHVTAQKNLLAAMPGICRGTSLEKLLAVYPSIAEFGGERCSPQRPDVLRTLSEIASQKICVSVESGAASGLSLSKGSLEVLCSMSLDWAACGETLRNCAAPLLASLGFTEVLSIMEVCGQQASSPLAGDIAIALQRLLPSAPQGAVRAGALATLIGMDFAPSLSSASAELRQVCSELSVEQLATAVAALGEKGLEDEDLGSCAEHLGATAAGALQSLPAANLLRLAVSATKSEVVARGALDTVAGASAKMLRSWSADDVSKFLLALAKAKCSCDGHGASEFFRSADAALTPLLPSLSSVQLLKIVMAIGKVPACKTMLEATAREATARASEFPFPQLMLLTQVLLPLGGEHRSMRKLWDFWVQHVGESTKDDSAAVTADQLAKLAQLLTPVSSGAGAVYEALSRRLESCAGSLSAVGQAALKATFPAGGGPEFRGKSSMLRAVSKAVGEELSSPSPEDRRTKGRSRSRRSRSSHGRGRSRSKSRSRTRRGGRRGSSSRSRGRKRR